MRWLCNENVPRALVTALGEHGHDVAWIATIAPGITDQAVLARAIQEQRILVTFDKDFGELAARTPLPLGCGVVLLRLPLHPIQQAAAAIAKTLHARTDWPGHFSVIEPGRIRMRSLQSPKQPLAG